MPGLNEPQKVGSEYLPSRLCKVGGQKAAWGGGPQENETSSMPLHSGRRQVLAGRYRLAADRLEGAKQPTNPLKLAGCRCPNARSMEEEEGPHRRHLSPVENSRRRACFPPALAPALLPNREKRGAVASPESHARKTLSTAPGFA